MLGEGIGIAAHRAHKVENLLSEGDLLATYLAIEWFKDLLDVGQRALALFFCLDITDKGDALRGANVFAGCLSCLAAEKYVIKRIGSYFTYDILRLVQTYFFSKWGGIQKTRPVRGS